MGLSRSHQLPVTVALAFLIFLIVLSFSVLSSSSERWSSGNRTWSMPSASSVVTPAPVNSAVNTSDGWTYIPERDSRRYGLTESQCDAAFSGLWQEFENIGSDRGMIGSISPKDVGIGWSERGTIRAMIHDNRLYVLEVKGCERADFRERSNSILFSINRALAAHPDPLPNVEFSFNIEDIPNDALTPVGITWALTRKKDQRNLWLMPDFGYWSWAAEIVGSYERVLDKIAEQEKPFANKIQKAVWRGAALNGQREQLVAVSNKKKWSDIEAIVWSDDPEQKKEMLPMYDHCKYMFAVHTEGRSYSGRLKYLLNCGSVVIIPSPLEWVEYFHHLLVPSGPNQNFVQVKTDFSDLEEKMNYYLEHVDEAQRIAENSIKTFRQTYLTPAAQACYWRKLFKVWRAQSFEPQMYKNGKEKKWRGIPFETYIIQEPRDIFLD